MNVNDIYELGQQRLIEEHEALEATKVGVLRGGSSGAMLYGTTPIGNCARKAYLRYKGIKSGDISTDRYLMFDGGLSNEDIWAKILLRGLPDEWTLLREEEVPIRWELPNGTLVTGRPDLVLLENGTPKVGIELKAVSALWTAKDILVNDEPKLLHMIQAGHYARILNIPWELWYTSRVDFTVSRESWQQRLFSGIDPAHVEIRTSKNSKTGKEESVINKILPFRRGYRLEWSPKGQLLYTRIGLEETPRHTIITWDAIEKYFLTISTIDSSKVLPPRPKNVTIGGEEGGYNMCDPKYCALAETCDKYETNLRKWLAAAELVTE
jgi:hypothetical protein